MSEAVKALRDERPRVLVYARRFLAAHWRLATVASLFDVPPEDLAAALEGPA